METLFTKSSTAAESIAATAKELASPFSTEKYNLTLMGMGVSMLVHELQMELIGSAKRSISTVVLCRRLRQIEEQVNAKVKGK